MFFILKLGKVVFPCNFLLLRALVFLISRSCLTYWRLFRLFSLLSIRICPPLRVDFWVFEVHPIQKRELRFLWYAFLTCKKRKLDSLVALIEIFFKSLVRSSSIRTWSRCSFDRLSFEIWVLICNTYILFKQLFRNDFIVLPFVLWIYISYFRD